MLCMCIEYHIWVNMYHVNTRGVDEHMINVHYYYYYYMGATYDCENNKQGNKIYMFKDS